MSATTMPPGSTPEEIYGKALIDFYKDIDTNTDKKTSIEKLRQRMVVIGKTYPDLFQLKGINNTKIFIRKLLDILATNKFSKRDISAVEAYLALLKTPKQPSTSVTKNIFKNVTALDINRANKGSLVVKTNLFAYQQANYNITKLLYPNKNPCYSDYFVSLMSEGQNLLNQLSKEFMLKKQKLLNEIYEEYVNNVNSGDTGKYVNERSLSKLWNGNKALITAYLSRNLWSETQLLIFTTPVDLEGFDTWKMWANDAKIMYRSFEPINCNIPLPPPLPAVPPPPPLPAVSLVTAPPVPPPLPVAQTPTPQPIAQTPTPQPVAQTPTPQPVAQTPTPQPVAQTPTPQPAAQTPTPQPVAQTPVAQTQEAPQPETQNTDSSTVVPEQPQINNEEATVLPPDSTPQDAVAPQEEASEEQINEAIEQIRGATSKEDLDSIMKNLAEVDYGDNLDVAIAERTLALEPLQKASDEQKNEAINKIKSALTLQDLSSILSTLPSLDYGEEVKTLANEAGDKIMLTEKLKEITKDNYKDADLDQIKKSLLTISGGKEGDKSWNTVLGKLVLDSVAEKFRVKIQQEEWTNARKVSFLITLQFFKSVQEDKDNISNSVQGNNNAVNTKWVKENLKLQKAAQNANKTNVSRMKALSAEALKYLARLRLEETDELKNEATKMDAIIELINLIVGDSSFDLLKPVQYYNIKDSRTPIYSEYEDFSDVEYEEYTDEEYGELVANLEQEVKDLLSSSESGEYESESGSYSMNSDSESGTYESS